MYEDRIEGTKKVRYKKLAQSEISLWLTIASNQKPISVSPAPSFSTTYIIMTSPLLVTVSGTVSDFTTKSGGGESVTSIGVYIYKQRKIYWGYKWCCIASEQFFVTLIILCLITEFH